MFRNFADVIFVICSLALKGLTVSTHVNKSENSGLATKREKKK